MTHDERVAEIDQYIDGLSYVSPRMSENGEHAVEHFSWTACDTCGCTLAGERHGWQGYLDEYDEWVTFEACTACTFEMLYPGEHDCGDQ